MTNVLDQIRQEASRRADLMPLEILEAAEKNLIRSRLGRLRKGHANPTCEKERDYQSALSRYVYYKLFCRRILKNTELVSYTGLKIKPTPSSYWFAKRDMEYWRSQMDRIEYDLSYGVIVVESNEKAEWFSSGNKLSKGVLNEMPSYDSSSNDSLCNVLDRFVVSATATENGQHSRESAH